MPAGMWSPGARGAFGARSPWGWLVPNANPSWVVAPCTIGVCTRDFGHGTHCTSHHHASCELRAVRSYVGYSLPMSCGAVGHDQSAATIQSKARQK